jgi:hypothetical protein
MANKSLQKVELLYPPKMYITDPEIAARQPDIGAIFSPVVWNTHHFRAGMYNSQMSLSGF